MDRHKFLTKTGIIIESVDYNSYKTMLSELRSKYHINDFQIVESASFSMAMIVRYALGLSSLGGGSVGFVNDSLCGAITLGTLRHIHHGGGVVKLFVYGNENTVFSDIFSSQLNSLKAFSVEIVYIENIDEIEDVFKYLKSDAHNFILGTDYEIFLNSSVPTNTFTAQNTSQNQINFLNQLIELFNDCAIPVHVIESPPGIDKNSGKVVYTPLYASSTLSLGIPLNGLYKGNDFVGRHYVCDISMPLSDINGNRIVIFDEQPVVQITPEHMIEK